MSGCFSCHEFGDGILQSGCGKGEDKSHDRSDQLVNSHIFFAEQPRKKNTVEETDKAAAKTCYC